MIARRWIAAACFPLVAASTAPRAFAALSPRVASYEIDARLEAAQHVVTGHEVITWRNAGRKPASDLFFHLYLNAFLNNRSTFMREAGEAVEDWQRAKPDGWGWLQVTRLVVDGDDRTAAIEHVQPDDDNVDDRTVIRVQLGEPIRPRQSARIEIDFVARLPKVFARSGYAGPFHLVAQWFPKIGVFRNGRWICHQYHLNTEFFADFGVYDVRLTTPHDFVVGATGTVQEERDNGDGSKTVRYLAEDVHDFAWAADPRFVELTDRFDGVTLRLLLQPRHRAQGRRYLEAAKAALEYYRDSVGRYPYPQLTIVDPGPGGFGAGGMEYPTLITTGTTWWMPDNLRFPEAVTVHELGHQYWYGMVASNEFEEAWLDEGVNSYVEALVMERTYGTPGSYVDLLGLRVDSRAMNRLGYLRATRSDPMVRNAWGFLDRVSYVAVSYSKTALVLATLERYLGSERMRDALRAYFERWRFRHPSGRDFVNAISEAAGEDLTWYFDQTVAGTGVLDYAVTRVDAEKAAEFAGAREPGSPNGEEPPSETRPPTYRNEIVVERLGSVRMPVEILVGYEDGGETTEAWDGRDRWHRLESTGTQRVEWAIVDPHGKLPLDVNLINNSRMRSTGTRGIIRLAGRWGFWFQNLLHFLTGM